MKDLPSWFNPDEYFNFITESSELVEMNIPYQKKKREIMLKRRRDNRTEALRQGRERSQEANELAQAKAKGIMQGLGEHYKHKLVNDFFDKLTEAKNPVEQTKSEGRPEVDPADRDRDRKREERKQKKLSGLADVLIVRNKKIGKLEIITTEDYNSQTHEVLKGRVGRIDKGPVSKPDLISVSKKAEFMNTKTSMRLLGKVEKETTKETRDEGGTASPTGESETMAPPPPPMPRVPRDGKEITDELSTFPDWDHQKTDLVAGIAFGLNSNQEIPIQISQTLSKSRTLADSVNRAVNQLLATSPSLSGMNFQLLPPIMTAGKMWSQLSGTPQTGPVATIIGSDGSKFIGVSVKVGQQIRPGNKGEPGLILNVLMNTEEGEKIVRAFSMLLTDYFKEVKDVFMTKLPVLYHDNPTIKDGRAALEREKKQRANYQDNKNIFRNRAKQLVEDLFNIDEDLKSAFILECLTGNVKFDGGPGTANMMISVNKDGSNANLIPLDSKFALSLGDTTETYLSVKFTDGESSQFDAMYDQTIGERDIPSNFISELEKIQELANPVNFMQFFNMSIADVVYKSPIDYSDYYDNISDNDTVVTFNPGSKAEKELRIAIKKNFDNSGSEENVIEKGIDHILEEYGMINDYLVDLVNNGNIPHDKALEYIREEFDFLTERNYRKEYDNYHSKPEQRANRSKRVLARRKMEKKGRVKKGDGKDVDHKNGNPKDNSDDNLRVLSKSKNRSMNEEHGAGFEGTPELVKKLIKDTPYSDTTPVLAKSKRYVENNIKPKK